MAPLFILLITDIDMKNVTDYLEEFIDLLIPIHPWCVIGGIHALKLHGLNVRDTEDFDVAVYTPPDSVLHLIREAAEASEEGSIPDFDNSPRRSFKITRNGLTIDFLIEYNELLPSNLLTYQYSSRAWPVQNIGVVIAAKAKYNREKDQQDFQQLKEQNFNS